MNKNDEQILVVKRDQFLPRKVQGYRTLHEFAPYLELMLRNIEVKRRGDMEQDPTYKQLISYVIVKNAKGETLVYQRLTGGGENRLHGLASIGVGGHMNPVDGLSGDKLLLENTYRELEEEIGVRPLQLGLVGVVNDDSNDVGKVHIGLIYVADIGGQEINVTETDTLSVKFEQELDGYTFETWSQILREAGVV